MGGRKKRGKVGEKGEKGEKGKKGEIHHSCSCGYSCSDFFNLGQRKRGKEAEKREKGGKGEKEENTVTPHTRSSPLRGSQISRLGVGKPRSGGDFLLWDGKKGEKRGEGGKKKKKKKKKS